KKVFTALKDVRVNMYLAKFPDGFMKDDIQPFVLIKDAEGKPVITCMLDGDWVTTASKDSSHSDEYHTAVSVLKPMFEQLWRLTKGDIKAIIEEIEGEATNNNLKNTFINRGSIHLIFNDNQVRTVVDNELEKEYDWGWTSNHYMYTEDKKEGDDPLAALLGDKANPKSEPTMVVETRKEPEKLPVGNEVFKPDPVSPGIGHNGGPAFE